MTLPLLPPLHPAQLCLFLTRWTLQSWETDPHSVLSVAPAPSPLFPLMSICLPFSGPVLPASLLSPWFGLKPQPPSPGPSSRLHTFPHQDSGSEPLSLNHQPSPKRLRHTESLHPPPAPPELYCCPHPFQKFAHNFLLKTVFLILHTTLRLLQPLPTAQPRYPEHLLGCATVLPREGGVGGTEWMLPFSFNKLISYQLASLGLLGLSL